MTSRPNIFETFVHDVALSLIEKLLSLYADFLIYILALKQIQGKQFLSVSWIFQQIVPFYRRIRGNVNNYIQSNRFCRYM